MNIDNNIEIPDEPAAPKRRRGGKIPSPAQGLINAIKFVKPTRKPAGILDEQYHLMDNGFLVATNGMLTIGTRISETINAAPNSAKLLKALAKVTNEYVLTKYSDNTLHVKSGDFNAVIECVEPSELSIKYPDPLQYPANNDLTRAVRCVTPATNLNSQHASLCSVLLQANTVVATDGSVIIECYHGNNLPPNVLLPKPAAQTIAKIDYELIGFGYSGETITFHYSNGTFVQAKLYTENYIKYSHLFDNFPEVQPLPDKFYTAVDNVKEFSKTGSIYLNENAITSDLEIDQSESSYAIDGMPNGMAFDIRYLKMIEHCMDNVKFVYEPEPVLFFTGYNCRGKLMGVKYLNRSNSIPANASTNTMDMDDDIPF